LKQQAGEYKAAATDAHAAAKSLESLVIDFNLQIRLIENDIAINQKEVSSVGLKVRQTELAIQAKETGIERTRRYIGAVLREIYESDGEEIVELLFQYQNFSDFFNQVEYREMLQRDLKSRLEEIKLLKSKLEQEKIGLDSKREELGGLMRELENRNSILDDQKKKKEGILKETRNEEWRYKELLKTTREKQDAIQREIFDLEDKLRQAIDSASIPTRRPGVLEWPAEGLLTQNYGCTKFAKISAAYPTCFHNGIDIAASYGTIVVAARGGRVIDLQNAPYAYGKWIAVEHDNGLVTLYAHLSLQSVSVGREVNKGDVIGYMGSTGYSTGSHLHFTVYAPSTFSTKPSEIAGTLPIGATLNPFDYLP
ncbi:MAG: peptidoglycan DD-metalloendopeptidase family protein, partial [Candidatus Spechtbacterales bacterium]